MNWFKKKVDALIEKEFTRRKCELELCVKNEEERLQVEYLKKNHELKVSSENLQIQIDEIKSLQNKSEEEKNRLSEQFNNFKCSIDKEFSQRKNELELSAKSEEERLRVKSQEKINELKNLVNNLQAQIDETKRVREKSEEEQKKLWERLDILRDNLNTEDVWVKLWECAYAKATDKVWEIMKKETLHLVGLAKEESYQKAKEEFDKTLEIRIDELIKKDINLINMPLLIKCKEGAKAQFLLAEKAGDIPKVNYNKGKLDLITEISNDKI